MGRIIRQAGGFVKERGVALFLRLFYAFLTRLDRGTGSLIPMTKRQQHVGWILLWGFLLSLTGLLLYSMIPYVTDFSRAAFVLERASAAPALWPGLLGVHIAAGTVVILSGPLLFLPVASGRKRLHAVLGRLYAGVALGVMLPTAFCLCLHAGGGWLGQLGFFVTGGWMMHCTVLGVRRILQGRARAHREWMLRSYAMAASALTFRLLYVGAYYAQVSYALNYPLSTWLSTLINAGIAEWIIRRSALSANRNGALEAPALTEER